MGPRVEIEYQIWFHSVVLLMTGLPSSPRVPLTMSFRDYFHPSVSVMGVVLLRMDNSSMVAMNPVLRIQLVRDDSEP